ncbi:MAG: hypothetical protein DMG14_09595 [Acidobacteria bacterium]|nr:MAG: hypothetical protein DMG14_09595 [Acidobacteriota bacterium]
MPNGLSWSSADVRITLAEAILTTAGKTAFTTGANVAGIVAASRTGAAAAIACSGAWAACTIEAPTKAPPAMDPMLSNNAAIIHIGYLLIRFMIDSSLESSKFFDTAKSDGSAADS